MQCSITEPKEQDLNPLISVFFNRIRVFFPKVRVKFELFIYLINQRAKCIKSMLITRHHSMFTFTHKWKVIDQVQYGLLKNIKPWLFYKLTFHHSMQNHMQINRVNCGDVFSRRVRGLRLYLHVHTSFLSSRAKGLWRIAGRMHTPASTIFTVWFTELRLTGAAQRTAIFSRTAP